ncbi:MAG: hypothetical protein JWO06_831 [Bacteroidota bacterium]|nr:hypothetical protein [Bacteroidota bacterium]
MEIPYSGRSIITDNFDRIEISIPVKKNWFIIIFLGAWLGGWLMGETVALAAVTGLFGKIGPPQLFITFWLVGWTAGGLFAIRTWIWNLSGKEVINIGQGQLTVTKKGALFIKPKTYDLNEVKNVRAQDDEGSTNIWGVRRNDFWNIGSGGTIRFDYGMKTIKFAGGVDEAEAKSILAMLTEKKILSAKNFAS